MTMGGFSINPFLNINKPKNCKEVVIKTQLFSPVPAVLGDLKVGDKLSIKLDGPVGPCVAVNGNSIAGTIISKDLYLIIDCMKKGIEFIGMVRNISGGSCSLTIQAKN
jgi:hypothetical protein